VNPRSLYGPVEIAATTMIGEHCTLGYPKEQRLRAAQSGDTTVTPGTPVVIGEDCLIANQVVLYEGVRIESACVIEDRVRIGYDCTIGSNTRIIYGAYLCDRITVGPNSRIAGFVCDGTSIGTGCTVMGELVHEYTSPHRDWWEVDEPSPTIADESVVGYGAQVIGRVKIGPRAYVAAGAVVTKDVPPEHVVTGVNEQTPADRWNGRRLQDLLGHWSKSRC
jgi:acetyltransferase-like isoleucine patch superfamily enzyme